MFLMAVNLLLLILQHNGKQKVKISSYKYISIISKQHMFRIGVYPTRKIINIVTKKRVPQLITEEHHIFLSPSWMKAFATDFAALFLPSDSYLHDTIWITGYLIHVCHNRTIYLEGFHHWHNQIIWPNCKTYLLSFFTDLTQWMFQITTRKQMTLSIPTVL